MFREYDALITVQEKNETTATAVNANEDFFNYWLTGTTANSATFQAAVGVSNPFSFPLTLGTVTVVGNYDSKFSSEVLECVCEKRGVYGLIVYDYHCCEDVNFAGITATINLEEGYNNLSPAITLHGMPTLTSRCSGSSITNKQFCVANELIGRIIAYDLYYPDGTQVKVTASYNNIFGDAVNVRMDLSVYAEDANPREIEEDVSLGLIDSFSTLGPLSVCNLLPVPTLYLLCM